MNASPFRHVRLGAVKSGAVAGLSVMLSVVTAALLGSTNELALGWYGAMLTLVAASGTFLVFGGNVFPPFFARHSDDVVRRAIVGRVLVASLVVSVLAVGAAVAGDLLQFADAGNAAIPVSILALIVCSVSLTTTVFHAENAQYRTGLAAVIQRLPLFATNLIVCAMCLADMLRGPSQIVQAFALAHLGAALCVVPLAVRYVWAGLGKLPGHTVVEWGRLARYAGLVQYLAVLTFFYENADRLILLAAATGGIVLVGVVAALQSVNGVVYGVSRQLVFAAHSRIARLDDDNELRELVAKVSSLSVAIVGLLSLCSAAIFPLASWAFGEGVGENSRLLPLMLATTCAMSVSSVTSSVFHAKGDVTRYAVGQTVMVAAYALSAALLVERGGLLALFLCQFVAQIVFQAWNQRYLQHRYGIARPASYRALIALGSLNASVALIGSPKVVVVGIGVLSALCFAVVVRRDIAFVLPRRWQVKQTRMEA